MVTPVSTLLADHFCEVENGGWALLLSLGSGCSGRLLPNALPKIAQLAGTPLFLTVASRKVLLEGGLL